MARYIQGTVASPAIGHDISELPNTSDGYRLLSVRATFTTSAVVANRYPHFRFVTPSGSTIHEMVPQVAQAAGTAVVYDLIAGDGAASEGSTAYDGVSSIPLPNLWWPHDVKLVTATTAIDAGDRWSSIFWSALVGDEWEHLHWLARIASQIGG